MTHLGDTFRWHGFLALECKNNPEPQLPLPEAVIFWITELYILNKNLSDAWRPEVILGTSITTAWNAACGLLGWGEGPKAAGMEEEHLTGPVNSLSAALCRSPTAWFAVSVKTSGQWFKTSYSKAHEEKLMQSS